MPNQQRYTQMASEDTYFCLQVWSDKKPRDFWDVCIWKRAPDAKKGTAQFVESTPRLSWMEGKPFAEVWAYLVEQKKLGRLLFSMTEENKSLSDDLFRGNRPSSSR
jgi:hypothetical protein